MSSAPFRALLRPRIGSPRVHHSSRTSRRQHQTSPSSPPSSSSPSSPSPTGPKPPNPNVAAQTSPTNAAAHSKTTVGGGGGRGTAPIPVPVANAVPPLPIWQRLGPLTRAGRAYARTQRARPWATQVATSLLIYLCADVSAQRMSRGDDTEKGHDPARTVRSLIVGGAAAIPGYCWFDFLARSFNFPSSRALSIATKVTVNQLCFTPVFGAYFFGAQALLSGDSAAEAWDRVRRTVPVSWLNGCKVWPAVTALNFAFVPLEYRAVFAGAVAVGWQTYLSWLNRQAEIAEEAGVVADAHGYAGLRQVQTRVGVDGTGAGNSDVLMRRAPVDTGDGDNGGTGSGPRKMVV